jgi:hypothetical protein
MIGPNAAVGTIEDTEQLVLKVRVAESDVPLVAEGQPVTADVDGRALNGTGRVESPARRPGGARSGVERAGADRQ